MTIDTAYAIYAGITDDQIQAVIEDLPPCRECRGTGITARRAGPYELSPVADIEESTCGRCAGSGASMSEASIRDYLTRLTITEGNEPPWL